MTTFVGCLVVICRLYNDVLTTLQEISSRPSAVAEKGTARQGGCTTQRSASNIADDELQATGSDHYPPRELASRSLADEQSREELLELRNGHATSLSFIAELQREKSAVLEQVADREREKIRSGGTLVTLRREVVDLLRKLGESEQATAKHVYDLETAKMELRNRRKDMPRLQADKEGVASALAGERRRNAGLVRKVPRLNDHSAEMARNGRRAWRRVRALEGELELLRNKVDERVEADDEGEEVEESRTSEQSDYVQVTESPDQAGTLVEETQLGETF